MKKFNSDHSTQIARRNEKKIIENIYIYIKTKRYRRAMFNLKK